MRRYSVPLPNPFAEAPGACNASDERDFVSQVDLKRVLVAYDFSDYSELALKYGLSIAQEHQAEVHAARPAIAFSERARDRPGIPSRRVRLSHCRASFAASCSG